MGLGTDAPSNSDLMLTAMVCNAVPIIGSRAGTLL
jgi:hypothetical protein